MWEEEFGVGPPVVVEGPLEELEDGVGPLVVLGVVLVGPLTAGDILNWKSRLK